MLATPKHGWSTISIGDWSDRCSYIDDVPFLLLEALEQSCRMHKPVAGKFDAEGWEYIIVFDWMETHIITDKDEHSFVSVKINRDDLAKELVSDIRRDLKDWGSWTDYGNMTDDGKEERRKKLLALCDDLEQRLPSNDWIWL